MADESCFIPTLRKNLKFAATIGAVSTLVLLAAILGFFGLSIASDYIATTGFYAVAGGIVNEIGSVIISNHTIAVVAIFAVLLVSAFREVSAGHKRWGYLGIVYTVYGFAIYMFIRALFWIHAFVIIGYPNGSGVIHDAFGGYTTIFFIIVIFLSWFGIVVPFERSIEKCFK
jgi:hypothetical protein